MRRLLPFALAALLFLTLIPGIAAIEATDWREARDAEVIRESTSGKEWLTPLYAREALFEKPLPGYAHEVIAQRLLRRLVHTDPEHLTDVATSRAVRAVLAAVLALLVGVVGTRAFGARAGWLAACALASTVGLPLAARADGGQLLATLCSWLGVASFLSVLQARARSADWACFLGWLALGAAALTGGPLSALWPMGGFALYFSLTRSRGAWRDIRPGWGALVVIGLMLPWYGVLYALHGTEFLKHVPWFPYAIETRGHVLAGALSALSYTLVLGFPWTPLLGASLRDAIARLRWPRAERRHGLADPGHASGLLLALLIAAISMETLLAFWLPLVFSGGALFALVTLPVEFDASARARRMLADSGIIQTDAEMRGVSNVLNAAALTYVAGLVTAVLQLLYYVSLVSGRDRKSVV